MNARKESRECIEGTPLVSNPHIIYPGAVSEAGKDRRRSRGDRTKSQQKGTATASRTHNKNESHQISMFTEMEETKSTSIRNNLKANQNVMTNVF